MLGLKPSPSRLATLAETSCKTRLSSTLQLVHTKQRPFLSSTVSFPSSQFTAYSISHCVLMCENFDIREGLWSHKVQRDIEKAHPKHHLEESYRMCSMIRRNDFQRSARGRAVQGARLRLWSRKRRGFKPHRTQIFDFFLLFFSQKSSSVFLCFVLLPFVFHFPFSPATDGLFCPFACFHFPPSNFPFPLLPAKTQGTT